MKISRIVLTAAAALGLAALSLSQGPPPGGPGMGGSGGGPGFGGPRRGPGGLAGLALRPDVAQELALTDVQRDLIQAYMEDDRPAWPTSGERPDPVRMEARRAAEEAALARILSAVQIRRLREIRVQMEGPRCLFDPAVQNALGLTADQRAKLAALRPQGVSGNGRGPGGPGGPPSPDGRGGRRGPGGPGGRGGEALLGILTSVQRQQFEALGGAPFVGARRGPGGPGGVLAGAAAGPEPPTDL